MASYPVRQRPKPEGKDKRNKRARAASIQEHAYTWHETVIRSRSSKPRGQSISSGSREILCA
jgi:hypothetical protein